MYLPGLFFIGTIFNNVHSYVMSANGPNTPWGSLANDLNDYYEVISEPDIPFFREKCKLCKEHFIVKK